MASFSGLLATRSWQSAVCRYGGYGDINAFYSAFAKLLEQPRRSK